MTNPDLNRNIVDGPIGTFFKFSDDNFDGDYLKDEVVDFLKLNRIDKAIILEKSNVSPIAVTIKTTSFLKQINWLKHLSLLNFQMKLEGVSYLHDIEKLQIDCTSEPIDFSHNKKLKELSITYNKKRNSIFDLINLEKLQIWSFSFHDLLPLRGLKKLKELELITTPIKNLTGIENMESLERLEICYAKNLSNLNDLDKAKKLKHLIIQNCPSLKNLDGIFNLRNLERLSIADCKNLEITDELYCLENLETLSINNTLDINSIKEISKLKNLKRLIINSKISNNDLNPILKLQKLEFLKIRSRKGYNLKEEEIKKQLNISEPDYKLILQNLQE